VTVVDVGRGGKPNVRSKFYYDVIKMDNISVCKTLSEQLLLQLIETTPAAKLRLAGPLDVVF